MILNILVLAGIILIVVTIVAYNSKRQVLPHVHDEQAIDNTPTAIFSNNISDTQPSASAEYIKEHI